MKRMKINFTTNDYRIDSFIEFAVNGVLSALLMLVKGVAVACILCGAQTLRGVVWRLVAFLAACAAVWAFVSHLAAMAG